MTSLGLSGGPTALRILLGSQLRRLREGRGISAQDAAKAIRGSESKISRIELGRNAVREIDVADLLSLYGVTDPEEREQLLSLASQANRPGWWYRYNDILPSWFRPTSGWKRRPPPSGCTSPSSSPACCRPRSTRRPCSPWATSRPRRPSGM